MPKLVALRHVALCGWATSVFLVSLAMTDRSLGQVIISEIMYNPNSSEAAPNDVEWVEILNISASTVDISGWILRDEDGPAGPIPAGSFIDPCEAVVLIPDAQTVADFQIAWGSGYQVFVMANWNAATPTGMAGLANAPSATNELLTLRNSLNVVFDAAFFDDAAPWPVIPPDGPSIYVKSGFFTAAANDSGANWARSVAATDGAFVDLQAAGDYGGTDVGSPGVAFGCQIPCVVDADCNDSNVCTTDTCSGGFCVYTNNSSPCSDGLFCTATDLCSGGVCSGSGNPCVAPADICVEASDSCVECLTAADCDDTVPCTIDACTAGVCSNTPDNGFCSDGNPCNGVEVCNAMSNCQAGVPVSCPPGQFCDPGSGLCVSCTLDSDCNDSNDCTTDTCTAGTCNFAPSMAGTPCGSPFTSACDNADTCNGFGACSPNNLADGTACPNGVFCDGQETCLAGSCTDNADPCLSFAHCVEATASCLACLIDADCSDGAFCNGAELCTANVCGPGTAPCPAGCDEPTDTCTGAIIISEIMYNPNSDESIPNDVEFVELYNVDSVAINVGGWRLQDEDGQSGPITLGTMIAPGEAIVIIPSDQQVIDYEAAWGSGYQIIPVTNWGQPGLSGLANGPSATNEILTVRNNGGVLIDEVNYDDDPPWPLDVPDGPSIYLLCSALNSVANDSGANWSRTLLGVNGGRNNTITAEFTGTDTGSPGIVDCVTPPKGACCRALVCSFEFEADCLASSGVWAGPGTICSDIDSDGVADPCDNCPAVPNSGQQNCNGDAEGDACDVAAEQDSDGDGDCNGVDNCPDVPNPGQEDVDNDGQGNACDCGDGLITSPEQCDGGACCSAICLLITAGTTCRVSAGPCDIAEVCNGSSGGCPADALVTAGTECRSSAGPCDIAESCNGSSPICPNNAFASAGTMCRSVVGTCDTAESCSGISTECPTDGFLSAGTACRLSAGVCDVAESCSGGSANCPLDGFVGAGTSCRLSAGICDVGESCTGSSAPCPADGYAAAGASCRPAAGDCDAAESCDGLDSDCPSDGLLSASTVCRPSSGAACDAVELCDGASIDCPANGDTTACIDGDGCCPDACGFSTDEDCAPIPTVSEWGVVILGLLLLTAAKVRFQRKEFAA